MNIDRKSPSIKVMADIEDTIVFSLAKQGYWGGNPELIYNAPSDIVMKQYNFNTFMSEYQTTEMVLNTENN